MSEFGVSIWVAISEIDFVFRFS